MSAYSQLISYKTIHCSIYNVYQEPVTVANVPPLPGRRTLNDPNVYMSQVFCLPKERIQSDVAQSCSGIDPTSHPVSNRDRGIAAKKNTHPQVDCPYTARLCRAEMFNRRRSKGKSEGHSRRAPGYAPHTRARNVHSRSLCNQRQADMRLPWSGAPTQTEIGAPQPLDRRARIQRVRHFAGPSRPRSISNWSSSRRLRGMKLLKTGLTDFCPHVTAHMEATSMGERMKLYVSRCYFPVVKVRTD